ncbi:dynein regulatory complex protein 8-like [Diprion similis]|uniref:dynein regulatory complex protein 8-like n=1 Tax=Diprion similis TaxID=362088 RepID=UPI001EF8CB86|nr:dynein regulatory complex protein 8-like [Diprion similis]
MAQERNSEVRRKSSAMRRGLSLSSSEGPNLLEKLIHNAFDVFDTAKIQEVDVRDLGTMIRSLGCVMTEAELQEIQVQLEDVENNSVSQSRFVEYMTKTINEHKLKPAEPEELLKAFQLFDPENHGYIMRDDLAKALMELGEPFTQDEVNEMMFVACDPATNRINYEHFINLLIVDYE